MFQGLSLWANAAVFVIAGIVVWLAGTRVTRYADAIQSSTGAGEAVVGMLLLGFITALPEVAVTATASRSGNAALAVNNLLGGMALNVAILAAADAAVRGEALTAGIASPTPMLQGTMLVLMLALVAGGTLLETRMLLGIGLFAWLVVGAYALALLMMRGTRGRQTWVPSRLPAQRTEAVEHAAQDSLGALAGKTAVGAAFILAAGYALAKTGDALAEQTGLGSSFFGGVFLALSTSLPEITVVFSAVRRGRYAMAVGDIFGANLFGLALLFMVDGLYRGGPALAEAGRFGTFAALLGIAVTALYLAGLLERGSRRIGSMGVDSLLVLAVYGMGIALLYELR